MTLTGLSLARHVALPDHGVGLDGQSCSCLIVGWPVGLSSPTLGVGRPSVMFLFDCWPVGRPMLRTVRGVTLPLSNHMFLPKTLKNKKPKKIQVYKKIPSEVRDFYLVKFTLNLIFQIGR